MPASSRCGQLHAALSRAVVVLAHRDVAAAAGEVDLEHAFLPLERLAGVAGKVARCPAVAVTALRVRGIIVEPHQRLFAPGQRNRFQVGIDRSLGQCPHGGILAAAHARTDLARLVPRPAARRHAVDLGLPGADLIERFEPLQRLLHGRDQTLLDLRPRPSDRRAHPARPTSASSFWASLSTSGAVCWWTDCTATWATSAPAAAAILLRHSSCEPLHNSHQSSAQSTYRSPAGLQHDSLGQQRLLHLAERIAGEHRLAQGRRDVAAERRHAQLAGRTGNRRRQHSTTVTVQPSERSAGGLAHRAETPNAWRQPAG